MTDLLNTVFGATRAFGPTEFIGATELFGPAEIFGATDSETRLKCVAPRTAFRAHASVGAEISAKVLNTYNPQAYFSLKSGQQQIS